MDRYWIQHPGLVWAAGSLAKDDGGVQRFDCGDDGALIEVKAADVPGLARVHEEQLAGVDDVCSLPIVHEGAVLHTVRKRFAEKIIYTNVSKILISLNPFAALPIYTSSYMTKYAGSAKPLQLEPHIFGLAQDALQGLRSRGRDQAVLISGESGAGKTESTKLVLSFVAEAVTSGGDEESVEQKVLNTNPVLEAFGNSMTVRNNNSSRFGKWLDMQFSPSMKTTGCTLTCYILEVSRVCKQASGERAFHVFPALLQAGAAGELGTFGLKLGEAKDYRYLKEGKVLAPGIDDVWNFKELKIAFKALRFTDKMQEDIFHILAGVLSLGNCDFEKEDEGARLKQKVPAERAAEMFQVPAAGLTRCMLFRNIVVGTEKMEKPLTLEQATQARDSVSRLIYGELFNWLVVQMNATMGSTGGQSEAMTRARTEQQILLGVLDIAGFESFEYNSLEQLFINLGNEHLQQQFNHTIFTLELEEYKKEGVDVDVDFTDNADLLALIDGKGSKSILDLLDEEANIPKSTDMSYVAKVIKVHEKHPRMAIPKFKGKAVFGIKHYAGEVTYTCDGFMEKNADKPPAEVAALLASSECQVLKNLGDVLVERSESTEGASGPSKSKKTKSISAKFRESLRSLMEKISTSDPHYIRCIKPNMEKVPDIVNSQMVYQQLVFSGVIDAISIRRQGFSSRILFSEFVRTYKPLIPKADQERLGWSRPLMSAERHVQRQKCEELVAMIQKRPNQSISTACLKDVKFGITKVLLRQDAMQTLDSIREQTFGASVIKIQSLARMARTYRWAKKAKVVQRDIRAWLDKSSIYEEACQVSRMSSYAGSSAIQKLGSPEAVKQALIDVEPLLQRANDASLRSAAVVEAMKMKKRMEVELDYVAQLGGLATSTDPVAIAKAAARAMDLGILKRETRELFLRMEKLQAQMPIVNAMRAVIHDSDENDTNLEARRDALKRVVEEVEGLGLDGKEALWLEELEGARLYAEVLELKAALPPPPPPPSKKKETPPPPPVQARRETVTGLPAAEQIRVIRTLQQASELYDSNLLERTLKEAMQQGISASDLAPAQEKFGLLQKEDFVLHALYETVEAAESIPRPPNSARVLQNLLRQMRALKGDAACQLEVYKHASRVCQEVVRRTGKFAKNGLDSSQASSYMDDDDDDGPDEVFMDLYNFSGLKPRADWDLKHSGGSFRPKGLMLSYAKEPIKEALTQVPKDLEGVAIKHFRDLQAAMGDRPVSMIEMHGARAGIMELVLAQPRLRDEIYVQVMKQLTENPSERSVLLGWQLLHVLCTSKPPSENLLEFVRAFGYQALNSDILGMPDEELTRAGHKAGFKLRQSYRPKQVAVKEEAEGILAALNEPRSWMGPSAMEMEEDDSGSPRRIGGRCSDRCSGRCSRPRCIIS